MNTLKLRDYQEHSLQLLRQAFSQGHKRVVLQLATGAGKTECACQIILNALSRGKRVVFTVNKIVLCEQASARLDKYEVPHGIYQANNERWNPEQPCQVASVQTLLRRKTLEEVDICIVDECHCHAKALEKLAVYNPDCLFIGLSATPYSKLAPWWQKLVTGVTMQYLMDTGHLVKYDVFAAPCADLSGVKIVAGEFHQGQLAEATDKPKLTGDVVSTYQKIGQGKQGIIFACNRAHAKHIANEFNRRGIPAESIDCYSKPEERENMIDAFNSCELRILVSIQVLTTGFDAPIAGYAGLACATKSRIKMAQALGRVLRPCVGKDKAIVADHGQNCERLGFPEDWNDTELDDGKRQKQSKTKEREAPQPKACPSCDYIKPAGRHKCPACGFAPENIRDVEFEAGELVRIQKRSRKQYSTAEKQEFLDGLNKYAKDKGYRKGKGAYGWSLHAYQDKFGCSPSNKMDWGSVGPITDEVRNWIQHKNIAFAKSKPKDGNTIKPCKKCGSTRWKRGEPVAPHGNKRLCENNHFCGFYKKELTCS